MPELSEPAVLGKTSMRVSHALRRLDSNSLNCLMVMVTQHAGSLVVQNTLGLPICPKLNTLLSCHEILIMKIVTHPTCINQYVLLQDFYI